MTDLDGWTVVVTRPAAQSAHLLARLQDAGACVLGWPTIRIEPLTVDSADRERWSPDRYDCVIYTSANAVELAAEHWPRPMSARVAAIGQATARSLRARGIGVQSTPTDGAGSEALLATTLLTNVRGQRLLIVRGRSGRELLRDTLVARGAEVVVAELYVRRVVRPDAAALDELRSALAAARVAVVVTSVDVLTAMLEPLPAELRSALARATLVVPSERVAAAAREHRWEGQVVTAASAEDDVMVAALRDTVVSGRS
jgi:uroporphyrinogen-III synthase